MTHDAVIRPAMILVVAMLATSCAADPSANVQSVSGGVETSSDDQKEKESTQGSGPGRLTGTAVVFGSASHAGVHVSASGWRETSTTTTDDVGRYELAGLAEGYNVVSFRKEGFASVSRGIMVARDQPAVLSETTLHPYGSIRGRVLYEDGRAAKSAIVLACQSNPPAAHAGVTKYITDEEGKYEIGGLGPGMHQITAFILDEKLGGIGAESGGTGVTVPVNPGEETVAETMELHRYESSGETLARSGCE